MRSMETLGKGYLDLLLGNKPSEAQPNYSDISVVYNAYDHDDGKRVMSNQ